LFPIDNKQFLSGCLEHLCSRFGAILPTSPEYCRVDVGEDDAMKSALIFFLSAVVGVSCGVTQNNVAQDAEEMPSSEDGAQFGYIRNGDELIGVPFKLENGMAVIGGHSLMPKDMLITSFKDDPLGLASRPNTLLWPGGRVPYELPANMEWQQEWNVMVAEWAKAGIRWVPRTPADTEYVKVVMGRKVATACGVSYTGRIPKAMYASDPNIAAVGGGQPLWLTTKAETTARGGNCPMLLTVIHEAGHALGFMHEHQRPDRDQYVTFSQPIAADNSAFVKIEGSKTYGPYDINSVLHYGTSNTGALNMRTKAGAVIAFNPGALSAGDIAGARAAYSAVMAVPTPAPTRAPTAPPVVASTPAPTASPRPTAATSAIATPQPVATVQQGRCLVVDGNQDQLFSGSEARANCQKKCESFASKEQRRCSWNGEILRAHPEARCVVTVRGRALVTMPSTLLSVCNARCDSYAKSNPGRTCEWGSRKLK
jgi:hypothetical protein